RPIAEIELELKHGSAAGLFELALGLTESLPLTLQIVSKGERGYLLAAGAGPPAVVAERLKLRPGMSVGDAFDLVLPSAAGQAVNNLPAVVEGSEPVEGVHQMRIGLRRLRAALSIFKSCLAKGDREMLRALLKPSLRALGPARDFDVFLTETMPAVLADFPDDRSVAAFVAQATATRDRVREDLAALLADPAHSRAWLTVGGWLAGRPVRSDRPVTQLAREVLDKRARKVRRAAKAAEGGALEALHALRIEIKNLRYAGEFFASLYDARAAKRVLKALRAAQDHLGYLNDAAVSDAVLARVEADAPSSRARAVARGAGIVAGHLRARHADLHDEAKAAYEACAALKPFWR
ncbi:MAG: CHAD domain-containing protein, partial [Alphaproteobacteria bacterium]